MGGADGEVFIVHHLHDPRGEHAAQLLAVGIGVAKIAKDVAAAPDQFKIVFVGFSCARSRISRVWISSMSGRGVLIPEVDFFWKA